MQVQKQTEKYIYAPTHTERFGTNAYEYTYACTQIIIDRHKEKSTGV